MFPRSVTDRKAAEVDFVTIAGGRVIEAYPKTYKVTVTVAHTFNVTAIDKSQAWDRAISRVEQIETAKTVRSIDEVILL